MQQQITRGDYLKDLITIYIENNLQTDITELYSEFIFQCGEIQKAFTPAQVIKISFSEQESLKLKNLNTCSLAGITVDGHKETFNGSLTFNTRGEVVNYEPTVSGSVTVSGTTANDCGCQGLRGVFSNCCQPAIKAYFSLNYVPTKLSELTNDTDFQDGVDVAESISIHNASTEAHPYIQGLISDEASVRASQTEALGIRIDEEVSVRASQTEALSISIGAETTAREEAVSLAITTTEAYTDSVLQSATTAINTTIGDLSQLDTSVKSSVTSAINAEVATRLSADNNLQNQIDGLAAASDVTDIVGTYAELQAYDTQHLNDNDIIKVLTDSTHNDQPSYYRFDKDTDTFSYIGSEDSGYTKAQADAKFVKQTTTINGEALSQNITLTATEVGALPSTTTINDLTTTAQQNALNSGVTSSAVTQIGTNTSAIASNTSAIASNTSDITGLKGLSNLSDTGNARLHALKAYSDNGELLTDAEGLADVKSYAHSTFDRSKFTVVGSPTITNEGIASNGDYQNYITANTTLDLTNKTCVVKGCFTINALQPPAYTQLLSGSAKIYYQYISGQNKSILQMQAGGIWSNGITIPSSMIGTPIYYILTIDSNSASCSFIQNRVNIGTLLCENITPLTTDTTFGFYQAGGATGKGYVSIDLKQFSITVNGVEVFNGNKTGIDTIKPDNYTVVGTPTISADGVASGFTTSNYLRTANIDLSNAESWEIHHQFTVPSTRVNTSLFQIGSSTWTNYMYFNSDGRCTLTLKLSDDSSLTAQIQYHMQVNTTYMIICGFDGSKYYNRLHNENGVLLGEADTSSNLKISSSSNVPITIGTVSFGSYYWAGSIDLNAFKIYVDGNLVYQPCLKIPYTESKTGSKIVSSLYRDRVNDMAEQFGYANYYTLDEDNGNFTLPQVEFYGLIARQNFAPSNKYKELTLGASGDTYVAPTDGWFVLKKTAGSSNYYCMLNNTTNGITNFQQVSSGTSVIRTFIPASKNDIVQCDYNATGTTTTFRFIYAKGSESEAN